MSRLFSRKPVFSVGGPSGGGCETGSWVSLGALLVPRHRELSFPALGPRPLRAPFVSLRAHRVISSSFNFSESIMVIGLFCVDILSNLTRESPLKPAPVAFGRDPIGGFVLSEACHGLARSAPVPGFGSRSPRPPGCFQQMLRVGKRACCWSAGGVGRCVRGTLVLDPAGSGVLLLAAHQANLQRWVFRGKETNLFFNSKFLPKISGQQK